MDDRKARLIADALDSKVGRALLIPIATDAFREVIGRSKFIRLWGTYEVWKKGLVGWDNVMKAYRVWKLDPFAVTFERGSLR
jgi:hypothetical protein